MVLQDEADITSDYILATLLNEDFADTRCPHCKKPPSNSVRWLVDSTHDSGYRAELTSECLGGDCDCVCDYECTYSTVVGMVQFKKKFIHAKRLRAAMAKAGDSKHTKKVKNAACRYNDSFLFCLFTCSFCRHSAYKRLASAFAYKERWPLPPCLVNQVRRWYPSPYGQYTGYIGKNAFVDAYNATI